MKRFSDTTHTARKLGVTGCLTAGARAPRRANRSAYTLVELLTAVLLSLVLMVFVVQIFGLVSRSVDNSRAVLEISEQLRSTATRLRSDLEEATATMMPPLSPESGQGYFEYTEGDVGPVYTLDQVAWNTIDPANPVIDTSVADKDDMLMLTIRSRGEPYVGRALVRIGTNNIEQQTATSPLAEVCWFVRGTTLYRRVLLIRPDIDADLTTPAVKEPLSYTFLYGAPTSLITAMHSKPEDTYKRGFFNNFDLSVRFQGDPATQSTWVWAPNTLADLTKPENRYAHQPSGGVTFPHHPHVNGDWKYLGLPTLCESSWYANPANAWLPGRPLPTLSVASDGTFSDLSRFDAWSRPLPYDPVTVDGTAITLDPDTGTIEAIAGPRVAEDVILTNVIGFDVKAWDPEAPLYQSGSVCLAPGDPGYAAAATGTAVGYGAYVDLGYGPINGVPVDTSWFSGNGNLTSMPRVYDTWSTHYEKNGLDENNNGTADEGANGFDDIEDVSGTDSDGDGVVSLVDGIVDDAGEQEARPPYERPLRGIQIKIRILEPDTRQIREVTIRQDFLPK